MRGNYLSFLCNSCSVFFLLFPLIFYGTKCACPITDNFLLKIKTLFLKRKIKWPKSACLYNLYFNKALLKAEEPSFGCNIHDCLGKIEIKYLWVQEYVKLVFKIFHLTFSCKTKPAKWMYLICKCMGRTFQCSWLASSFSPDASLNFPTHAERKGGRERMKFLLNGDWEHSLVSSCGLTKNRS